MSRSRGLVLTQESSFTVGVETTAVSELGHGGDDRRIDRRRARPSDESPLATLQGLPALVVLERLPVPALAVALDGSIVFANQAFLSMLGHTASDLTGLTFDKLCRNMPADEAPVSFDHERGGWCIELCHADGWIIRALMSRSAFRRVNDPLSLTTFRDLTEELWTMGARH